MSTEDQILSIVASEEGYLASILSAEVVKTSQTAYWLSQISFAQISSQSIEKIINEIIDLDNSVSCILRTAADKEVGIAAKVNAVKGIKNCLTWAPGDCPCRDGGDNNDDEEASGELLINGDFETGDFSGWTETDANVIDTRLSATVPFSGYYVAELPSETSSISQAVSNIPEEVPIQISLGVRGTNFNHIMTMTLSFRSGTTVLSSEVKEVALDPRNQFITLLYVYKTPANTDNILLSFTRDTSIRSIFIDNVSLQFL